MQGSVPARSGEDRLQRTAKQFSKAGPALHALAAVDRIWFETAMKDGGGVTELLEVVPPSRVLFGAHLPLDTLESAVRWMRAANLDDGQRQVIEQEDARRLREQQTSAASQGVASSYSRQSMTGRKKPWVMA